MKKTILFAAALIASVSAFAQPVQPVQALATPTAVSADKPADKAPEGFKFETVKEVPITSVKDQASSGTCWCYSGISFLESEILRATNGKVEDLDLAEMSTTTTTSMPVGSTGDRSSATHSTVRRSTTPTAPSASPTTALSPGTSD